MIEWRDIKRFLGNLHEGKNKTLTLSMKANLTGDTTQANKVKINKADNYALDMVTVIGQAKEFGFSSFWKLQII